MASAQRMPRAGPSKAAREAVPHGVRLLAAKPGQSSANNAVVVFHDLVPALVADGQPRSRWIRRCR